MKNIKLFNKILLSIGIIFIILILILFILGNIERVGYLSDISINADDTLELNNIGIETTKKLFSPDDKLDYSSLTNYIFTNSYISKYSYNFRISYYSKVFRNSDIYGVYLDTGSLPDYMSNVKFHEKGSPFGILSSSKKVEENINNIKYTLRIRHNFLIILLLLYIVLNSIIYLLIKNRYYLQKLFYKISNINGYACILVIFLCFLIMPSVVYKLFYNETESSNFENRKLADKPNFDIRNLDAYTKLYESYFNDYVPFRSLFLQLKNLIDINIFNTVISDNPIISIGKDKWLFYTVHYNYLTDYFNSAELEIAKNYLINYRNILKKNGIDFIFMVCPTKESIYTEFYTKLKTINKTSADKLVEYLEHNTDLKTVYPKNALLENKNKYQLYYKYDTHWNSLGAYIGYRELTKKLSIYSSELNRFKLLEFSPDIRGTNNNLFYNNLAYILGFDKFSFYRDDKIYYLKDYYKDDINVLDYTKTLYYTNSVSSNEKRIYVINDSYMFEMREYLKSAFKESVFTYDSDITNILNNKPDIVIMEMLEMYLKERILK